MIHRVGDLLDLAEIRRDAEIQSILAARVPYSSGISSNGFCHHCNEDIESPKLFCSKECSKSWSRINET